MIFKKKMGVYSNLVWIDLFRENFKEERNGGFSFSWEVSVVFLWYVFLGGSELNVNGFINCCKIKVYRNFL